MTIINKLSLGPAKLMDDSTGDAFLFSLLILLRVPGVILSMVEELAIKQPPHCSPAGTSD